MLPAACETARTASQPTESAWIYKVLSLDGGGIRGVFPAAFLARLEDRIGQPIGSYFDLIVGTSTGGIIAIGLGLGLSARDILQLYEEQGRAIFDQEHGQAENWLRQRFRGAWQFFDSKYSSEPLKAALTGIMGQRRLGESRTRLVIPAWHPMLERVYLYKTAHHPRLEIDYKELALDAAMATAAAPTFLKPHLTSEALDRWRHLGKQSDRRGGGRGGGTAGLAGRPPEILSIGTINDVRAQRKWKGKLPMASSVARPSPER